MGQAPPRGISGLAGAARLRGGSEPHEPRTHAPSAGAAPASASAASCPGCSACPAGGSAAATASAGSDAKKSPTSGASSASGATSSAKVSCNEAGCYVVVRSVIRISFLRRSSSSQAAAGLLGGSATHWSGCLVLRVVGPVVERIHCAGLGLQLGEGARDCPQSGAAMRGAG